MGFHLGFALGPEALDAIDRRVAAGHIDARLAGREDRARPRRAGAPLERPALPDKDAVSAKERESGRPGIERPDLSVDRVRVRGPIDEAILLTELRGQGRFGVVLGNAPRRIDRLERSRH